MKDIDAPDILAARNGDGEAYARVVQRHQGAIARRMWRFTRDRGELERLVQDVFVEAYMSLGKFRGDAPFSHWLNVIATRTGYRFWRRRDRRRRELPLENWDAPGPAEASENLEAAEAGERLHRLLERLPPRDRLVLTLMYLEDLSVAETAKQTGWSKSMVKVQAHRARKKLRTLLEKEDRSDHHKG